MGRAPGSHVPSRAATDEPAQREQPPAARDGYLDAARECILDVGWRRTTLTEVARRAGVSRMTIYRAWSDMPALLGDLMTREWGTLVVDRGTTSDPTPESVADAIVATVRALRDNELFTRIVELDPELILPYLLSRRGRSQELILEVLSGAIASGQAAGSVRAGESETIARGLVLAAHGFVLSAHTMVDDAVDHQRPDPARRRARDGRALLARRAPDVPAGARRAAGYGRAAGRPRHRREVRMSTGTVVVLNGTSSSGKTSLAKALATNVLGAGTAPDGLSADAVPALLAHRPLAIEGMDARLVDVPRPASAWTRPRRSSAVPASSARRRPVDAAASPG
mgnify:CR=1 FL=1